MKKYFVTGIVILLPVFLTVIIVTFFINFLTKPFLGTVEEALKQFDLFNQSYFIFQSEKIVTIVSKFIILIGLTLVILGVGLIGKIFLIEYVFRIGNGFFYNIPYVNKIYKACQDVVHSLLSSESKSFSQVVLVPFPTLSTLSVGLVTRQSILLESVPTSTELIPVFIPGTPNPSVGFLLMFKKENLIFVNMKIDEAMKFVVSCGVVVPEFTLSKESDTQKELFDENAIP